MVSKHILKCFMRVIFFYKKNVYTQLKLKTQGGDGVDFIH